MAADEPMDLTEDVAGWKHLPVEIRRNIMMRLAFPDKQNMMLVNWDAARISTSLPNKLQELTIMELPSTAKTILIMKWKNQVGRIVSRMVEFRGTTLRQTECPEHTAEAMRAFLKIWRRSKIKNVVIEIPCFEGLSKIWDDVMQEIKTSIAVRSFNIRTNDYRLVTTALTAPKNSRHEISLLANDHGGMETAIFDLDKTFEIFEKLFKSLKIFLVRNICSIIWNEVDEEGYSYATRGPTYDIPAAIGITQNSDGTPTFIFRIIRMTREMSRTVYERCSSQCPNMKSSEDVERMDVAA
uniref:F-box domain-containing protein n=1 Tax=Caenorhabditis japonica TaxID=281687 RepID=A0A8R1HU54_CAEJA